MPRVCPNRSLRTSTQQNQRDEALGYAPPFKWFLAFALDSSDPAELEKTLRQMGQDYLRNRRSLE